MHSLRTRTPGRSLDLDPVVLDMGTEPSAEEPVLLVGTGAITAEMAVAFREEKLALVTMPPNAG